ADLQPIYDRHSAILGEGALELTLDLFRSSSGSSEDRRSAGYLLEWQIESQAARAVVELDEREVAWESSAVIDVAGARRIPYQRAPIEIANSRDRAERLAIDDARARAAQAEHSPLRLERIQREKAYIEELELADDYIRTFGELTGISLPDLGSQCASFIATTQAMWDDTLPFFLRRTLGITTGEATRADALALFRGREFDGAFPGSDLEPAIRRYAAELSIDPFANGRIIFDLEEREGKDSRAFCAPVRVPEEVYLVLRPHGGVTDYTTLLHELGHALHFGFADPHYPFEYRWLGDNSVTEGYAMLFDHLMQNKGWLLRYTGLGKNNIGEFLRMAAFEELHFLRRYCAKLLYELEVYSGKTSWDVLPEAYVETLSRATGFRYRGADAFIDLDPRFYSSRYLRAWQLQSILAQSLVGRFDEDWFRNPAAGPWIVENLFAEGQRETATELAVRASGASLSFDPLVRAIERGLTG
ncbi:MAG TPA: hypothetical protein VMY38_02505, partial [Gemmatimonadaceae bacterium]|nr:hypothetical protein [Gemmatimonadaceae bacterium]